MRYEASSRRKVGVSEFPRESPSQILVLGGLFHLLCPEPVIPKVSVDHVPVCGGPEGKTVPVLVDLTV